MHGTVSVNNEENSKLEDCRKSKDLHRLFNILNTVCEDGNVSTNKDATYVNLLQTQKF